MGKRPSASSALIWKARLTCVYKTRYCCVSCQTDDSETQGHRKECKKLVEANALEAAARASGDALRSEAVAPLSSPKAKTVPPLVKGSGPSREDVARAKTTAAAAKVTKLPAEDEKRLAMRCLICYCDDWDVNVGAHNRQCCYESACRGYSKKCGAATVAGDRHMRVEIESHSGYKA